MAKRDKNNPVEIPGRSVEVRNGNVNEALRKFKKKVQEDGVLQQVKDRKEYLKPSAQRARAKAAARARWLKKLRKESQTEARNPWS